MTVQKKITTVAIISIVIIIATVYFLFDPSQVGFFPPCPLSFLHVKCPGCGSQRALHSLLHLDIAKAFSFNPLLVISIPYILLGIYFEYLGGKVKFPEIRKKLFGKTAIIIAFVIIILYWIGRNVF